MNNIEEECFYQFNTYEEAVEFLRYHLLDRRTEVILSHFLTQLQRGQMILDKDIEEIKTRLIEKEIGEGEY